ncbi:MAG: hypothetical protein Q9167_001447 [Letrouitia subvulpina]
MTCSTCENIQFDDLNQELNEWGYPGHPHHRNFQELQSCSGCDFCQRVAADVASNTALNDGSATKKWRDQQVYLRIFSSSTSMDESEKTNMLVYCSPWEKENGRDQTYLATYGLFLERTEFERKEGMPDPKLEGSTLVNGRPVALSSDCDECFRLAKLWLEQCVKASGYHDLKHRSVDGYAEENLAALDYVKLRNFRAPSRDLMPSRTIDVGVVDGDFEPRLVCHANRGDGDLQENWVTLSHCWSGSAPLKTTTATISQWQEGIPLDKMPSTFRDAVCITRRLGLRHLWIDSLCIIQDSPEDWESEAARMGEIYRYGLLNIAAETARTCHDGLFSRRIETFTPVRLPLNSRKYNTKGQMLVRSRSLDMSWDDILGPSASTLNSRGWVLQESFLSPRTLHYGKQHMFWECSHCTLSEISIVPLVNANANGGWASTTWFSSKMVLPRAIISQQSLDQVVRENEKNKRRDIYDAWLKIVSNYRTRKLTFYSDIFFALAGIASIFQVCLGDRYLAGLFEGDLLRSLLWRVTDPSAALSASRSCAPSWSWASVVGVGTHEVTINRSLVPSVLAGGLTARILHAETYLNDGAVAPVSHLLNISGGKLELEGYLYHGPCAQGNLGYESCKWLDSIEGDGATPNKVRERVCSCHFDLVDEDSNQPGDVVLLHLGAWEWRYGLTFRSNRIETALAGLLLRPVDSRPHIYRRVGITKLVVGIELNGESYRFLEDAEKLIAEKWAKAVVTVV